MTIQKVISNSIKAVTAVLMFLVFGQSYAQNSPNVGTLSGNFQFDAQMYYEDTAIGAPEFKEQIGSNAFVNLLYSRGNFKAGMRFESYFPTQQGYLRETGAGIPYRFLQYANKNFDITAGTFYEQFGSGMILRAYEEWGLGFDNTLDGVRMRFTAVPGVRLTGIIGKQRNAFAHKIENLSEGIVRGFDADWSINESIAKLGEAKTRVRLGFAAVSRFQEDFDPIWIFPENVLAMSGRANLNRGKWNVFAEYAYKINDPSTVNALIYKPGNGFLLQASYSQKGLGISAAIKRIDNMDFRWDRGATGNNLNLNFLPPQTRQHTYRLATLFPWATQPLGEVGMQGELLYTFKKGSSLGGKYGTTVGLNYSRINNLDAMPAADPDMGYEAEVFSLGQLYFQDLNGEISHKFNKKFKASFSYLFFKYEKDLFKQLTGFATKEDVRSHIQILEIAYKIKSKRSMRFEFQSELTKQDFGSWAMILAELNMAPHWAFAAFDEWNYGNVDESKRFHYPTAQVIYKLDSYRFTVGYGRQRAGVLCVGGVCRVVPAANGFTLSVVGNF